MAFDIPKVETDKFYLDAAFRKARTKGSAKKSSLKTDKVTKAKVVLSPQLKLRTGEPSSSYYANDDLQSKFVQEFLSYEQAKQERTKNADLRQFISLPESAVHPQAQHQLVRQAKCNKKSSSNKSTALRSTTPRNNDRQRLAELSKALHKKTSKGKPYVEVNMSCFFRIRIRVPTETINLIYRFFREAENRVFSIKAHYSA